MLIMLPFVITKYLIVLTIIIILSIAETDAQADVRTLVSFINNLVRADVSYISLISFKP
ncbi:hypothetical protein LOAG_18279 [Loa loa]|uniref:Uncharacterized protein n=1 Tax=Loa loa TaxID=7209 RepID=A0A1S0UHN9_LOALO|nr:hypothetical protein LOAG_18279 [Loa loa]EJD74407.1 hypothetical protein LOAG_18279 [Loa loa]